MWILRKDGTAAVNSKNVCELSVCGCDGKCQIFAATSDGRVTELTDSILTRAIGKEHLERIINACIHDIKYMRMEV